ncbi:MAG TPA: cytochrome C, partial [Bacteroidales bacterium]|nr:cytochrome C [Bacteroidales bacterium]
DLEWERAIVEGMKYVDMPYSGEHGFIATEMYMPVNHMVSVSSEALSCKECHTREEGRLATLTDFYMPGRDRNEWLDFGGKMVLLGSLFGIIVHAAIRFTASRRRKLAHQHKA